MATIADLVRLVAPPAVRFGSDVDWDEVEQLLELRLPTDYKDLVAQYGTGAFNSFVRLFVPTTSAGFIENARETLDELAGHREEWPEDVPYAVYPEPGGLLAWAETPNGDRLFWLTGGDPATWPVVTCDRDLDDYALYRVDTVTFIHDWLSRRLTVKMLDDAAAEPAWFEHYRDRVEVYLYLSEGHLPYEQRLEILRDVLAPTASHGSWNEDGKRQDHFAAVVQDWELTYENACGHMIRVSFPPGEDDLVRTTLFDAVARMGCELRGGRTNYGTSVGWHEWGIDK